MIRYFDKRADVSTQFIQDHETIKFYEVLSVCECVCVSVWVYVCVCVVQLFHPKIKDIIILHRLLIDKTVLLVFNKSSCYSKVFF